MIWQAIIQHMVDLKMSDIQLIMIICDATQILHNDMKHCVCEIRDYSIIIATKAGTKTMATVFSSFITVFSAGPAVSL